MREKREGKCTTTSRGLQVSKPKSASQPGFVIFKHDVLINSDDKINRVKALIKENKYENDQKLKVTAAGLIKLFTA